MNIREDIKSLKTGTGELRKFGLMVGGVFVVLGLLFWWRHKPVGPYFLGVGVFLVVFGLAAPRVLRPVFIGWMSAAFVLGYIVSHVLLIVFFFLVVTPIGLLARCFGSDFLSLKLDPAASGYWIKRQQRARKRSDYERQF